MKFEREREGTWRERGNDNGNVYFVYNYKFVRRR